MSEKEEAEEGLGDTLSGTHTNVHVNGASFR